MQTETFPVAAPQEKQKLPEEAPNFIAQTERLEDMARQGIETPNGIEYLQFRAGIESEFAIVDPKVYRKYLAEREESDQKALTRKLENNPSDYENIHSDHEKSVKNNRDYERNLVLNPENIDIDELDNTELIEEFKQYATAFVGRLSAKSPSEEAKKADWLNQIPSFGVREMINFLLYEEFSRPTLEDVKPPVGGTLEQLDAYSEAQGWLEFRFGNGTLQTGYYDNDGMCEMRLAPCSPSEQVRRKLIIQERLVELANEFGVLIRTGADHEHVNLSTYSKTSTGEFVPIVGLDEQRRPKTLAITAGISKAYAAGLLLHPSIMKQDVYFTPYGDSMEFSSVRKTVRLMGDVVELRGKFGQADQAVNMLVAGAIDGLHEGYDRIKSEGIEVPEEATVQRVHRQPDFDKEKDLQIQRAFENATFKEGEFDFNALNAYNFLRADEITQSLLGNSTQGSAILNSFIISSVEVGREGTPHINPATLQQTFNELPESFQQEIQEITGTDFREIAARVNPRLEKVRLEAVTTIAGKAKYGVNGRAAAMERLRNSPIAHLTLGDETDHTIKWLQDAMPAS